MNGQEQSAYMAIGAVVIFPTLVWMMGASALAGIKGGWTRLVAMQVPRVPLPHIGRYIGRYFYRGDHRR